MEIFSSTGSKVLFTLVITILLSNLSCASKKLLYEKYEESYYKVEKLLPDDNGGMNPTFLVYSDNQYGWRAIEKFRKSENWTSKKMYIFPFYQLYLLGNGVVGGINYMRKVPDKGNTWQRRVRDAMYAEAKAKNVDFILNVGDMNAADGRRASHWGKFLKKNRKEVPLLDEIPYLPVPGNHERTNDMKYGLPNYNLIFDYPLFYATEFKDAVLLVLNSNMLVDQKSEIDDDLQDELFEKWFVSNPDKQKPSWLEEQLSAFEDKKYKIIAMHHPPICFIKHYIDWQKPKNGRDLITKRQKLIDLFEKYNVQVIFSGHEHAYQHSILNYGVDEKMHFIAGGGGGTPLRDVEKVKKQEEVLKGYRDQGMNVDVIAIIKMYHYFIVDIKPEKMTISIIEVTKDKKKPTKFINEIEILPATTELISIHNQ